MPTLLFNMSQLVAAYRQKVEDYQRQTHPAFFNQNFEKEKKMSSTRIECMNVDHPHKYGDSAECFLVSNSALDNAQLDKAARVLWETSRRDEGTISYAGANIAARALAAAGLLADKRCFSVSNSALDNVQLDYDDVDARTEAHFMKDDATYDEVNHPQHYTSHPSGVECITVTQHMNFCIGNAVKYLWRVDDKDDPITNLHKAKWYIEKEIERRLQVEDAQRDKTLAELRKHLEGENAKEGKTDPNDVVNGLGFDDYLGRGSNG